MIRLYFDLFVTPYFRLNRIIGDALLLAYWGPTVRRCPGPSPDLDDHYDYIARLNGG